MALNRTELTLLVDLIAQIDYLEDERKGTILILALKDLVRDRPMRTYKSHDEQTLYEWLRKIFSEWVSIGYHPALIKVSEESQTRNFWKKASNR